MPSHRARRNIYKPPLHTCSHCWADLTAPTEPHFCRRWTKPISGTCPFCHGRMRLVKGEIPPHNPRPNPSLSREARERLRFVCKRPGLWRQKDPTPVLPLEFAPILRDIAALSDSED